MNDRLLHRTRRQHYLIVTIIVLIAVIIGCVWILDSIHSNESLWGWTLMLQCLIPLLSIVLAGVFVSLPGKIVRSKVILVFMFVALLCLGISVYANLESNKQPSLLETILFPFNSTLASFFPSRGDYSLTEYQGCHEVNIYKFPSMYLLFHALCYFYVAWLGFSVFGRKLLNRVAARIMPLSSKNLIWGYSEGAFELAKDMILNTEKDEPIFLLDDDIEFDSEKESRIFDRLSNESILAFSTHYENLSKSSLDFNASIFSWFYWRRKLTTGRCFEAYRHYFITENQDFNVKYALLILNQLYFQKDKLTGKTHIFVRTEQEGIDVFFQEKLNDGLSDYVEVHIFNQSDITARQFAAEHPILDLTDRVNPITGEKWLTINHESLHVDGEINILLLGLGWTGYEMLKKLVSDSQFIGDYKTNIVVVDNDYKQYHGRYQYIVQEAAKFGVNICINPLVWLDDMHKICHQWLNGEKCSRKEGLEEKSIHQANSHLFYEWLSFVPNDDNVVNILRFNRIIVALGSDELNINTALQITNFRNHYFGAKETIDSTLMPEPIFAHVRDKEAYSYYEESIGKTIDPPIRIFGGLKSIYNAKTLVEEKMDRIAKLVNYVYSQYMIDVLTNEQLTEALQNGNAEKEWAKCTIFDQDSSRAVAMNIDNILRIAGNIDRLRKMLDEPLYIERLSELEHKRWNAFHYMRGIGSWKIDEVQEARDRNGNVKAKGKLFFNGALVRHICLVGYEELDAATRRVNILGNTSEDYKASDKRIIRHFPIFYQIKNS